MNIFGFFLFLRFHTYYKSADDIKNIHNKLLSGQVTLLMFSSILFQIPDFLKATLEKYLVLVSKLGVPKTNIKQDGKNDFWHALNGNNIKLFAVFEKGRLIGVQDNSSVFEDLHMGGQSHITFRMKDLTGSKIEYLGYPNGYYEWLEGNCNKSEKKMKLMLKKDKE